MWQKFKEQIPAVILTALLVIGGAFWLHQQTVNEMTAKQQAELGPLREKTDALTAAVEENRRQSDATNKLLKDAISKREADVFKSDEEVQKLNTEHMDQLAEAIAKKIQPYNPLPKSPEEAEKMQNEQVDKVSSRMAERIQPILAEMAKDQNLTRDSIAQYSQRISDQVGSVLTSEMNRNQQLNNNLQQTQAAAQDALKLSHEITALYLSSFKDQGLITRLLTLPANVVKDAASLSIVSSSDRKKVEESLVTKMNDIEKRLNELQAQNPQALNSQPVAAANTPMAHPQRPASEPPAAPTGK
jgi:CHASE3 domain sensor protein